MTEQAARKAAAGRPNLPHGLALSQQQAIRTARQRNLERRRSEDEFSLRGGSAEIKQRYGPGLQVDRTASRGALLTISGPLSFVCAAILRRQGGRPAGPSPILQANPPRPFHGAWLFDDRRLAGV